MRNQLTLRPADIRRILEQSATTVIVTRRVSRGSYEVHDASVVARNQQHSRAGRSDLRSESLAFVVEVTEIGARRLADVDFAVVLASGFKTQRDFYDDWLRRRRCIDVDQEVQVCTFKVEADRRFLHARVHRGYTTDPKQAAHGEPEALTAVELDRVADEARARRRVERAHEQLQQDLRSLAIRLKEAARTCDLMAAGRIRRELEELVRAAA